MSVKEMIQDLYKITNELETMFPGRKFTPDGHLVGSIGEVLVAERYGLTLLKNSTQTHDAVTSDGRFVQIKATQIDRIAISSNPAHLIVIKINPNGDWHQVYNGPGKIVWDNAGKVQKNGQRPISLSKLRALMDTIDEEDILPLV